MPQNYTVGSVTFVAGAGAFNLGSTGGHTLTVASGGIAVNSTQTQTISTNLFLSNSQTWNLGSGDLVVTGNIASNWITLTKTGTGTLTLAGNNAGLTGPIAINNGTVVLSHNNALGGSNFGNTVAAGASLALTGGITLTEGDFFFNGGGFGGSGALRNAAGNNTFNADAKLNGATTFVSDSGQLTFAKSVATNGHVLTLGGAGGFVSNQQIAGNGGLVVGGSGARTFQAAVNVSGAGLAVNGSGDVVFNANVNAGSQAVVVGGSGNTVFNGAEINSGGFTYSGSGSLDASSKLNLGGGSLVVSGAGDAVFSGPQINVGDIVVSGSGQTALDTQINAASFTQTGSGTTTLGGSGTNFFGAVTVTGGTLVLDKDNGAAIQTNGPVTFGDADIVFAADSQITAWTNVTLESGATLFLNDTTQSINNLVVNGDAVIDFGEGGSTFNINQLTLTGETVLTITNWVDTVDSFFASLNPGSSSLAKIIFDGYGEASWDPLDTNSGFIVPGVPIPEPSSYGALLLTLLVSAAAARRRPRQA